MTAPTPPASSTRNSSRPEAVRSVAGGRGQGQADGRSHPAPDGRIPGRGFQFLAIYRGQCRGGGLGREGREFGQAVRQRSDDAAKPPPKGSTRRMASVPGIADLAVFNSLGQPTVRIDVDRAKAARLRACHRRRQCRWSRPRSAARRRAISTRRAATEISPSLSAWRRNIAATWTPSAASPWGRTNPPAAGVGADTAGRCRHGQAGLGRLLHLSREPGALHPDQILGARPRSWRRGAATPSARSRGSVQLPSGYRLEWVGEFGEFQDAMQRLAVIVPLSHPC